MYGRTGEHLTNKNSTPKISIIVPVYGEDQYLDECISSILEQTYKNIEVILVDDESPDLCPEICDKYAILDSRINVIHKKNAGLVEARKTGISHATGDYISYVDGDDWIESDLYERMMQDVIEKDIDIVIDGYKKDMDGRCYQYNNSLPIGFYDRKAIESFIIPNMISKGEFYTFGIYTYVWNKLFRRDIVFQNQLSVDSSLIIGEDSSCVYPSIYQANSILITDYCGYHYRQRTGSLLRQSRNGEKMYGKLQNCYSFLSEKFAGDGCVCKQIDNYYLSQLVMLSDCLVNLFPEIDKRFPFENIPSNSRIIIYSAGAFGYHLYQQYLDQGCFQVIALCDQDYDRYNFEAFSPETIRSLKFDFVVIASVDSDFVRTNVETLTKYGVRRNKIITIQDTLPTITQNLKKVNAL